MKLKDLQQKMSAAMLSGEPDDRLLACIQPGGKLQPEDRLKVYRDSIFSGFSTVMRVAYPVCYKLVGDLFFAKLVEQYIKKYPSVSSDLDEYGKGFSDFISSFPQAAGLPYLADVARLEWACYMSTNTANAEKMDQKKLAILSEQDGGSLIFSLPKNASLVCSPYPIIRIWEINQDDYTGEEEVNLNEGKNYLFIWRYQSQLRIDVLTAEEFFLLGEINKGQKFIDICEALKDKVDIAGLLPILISNGWISDVN